MAFLREYIQPVARETNVRVSTATNEVSYDRLYEDMQKSVARDNRPHPHTESLSTSSESSQPPMSDEELMRAVCTGDKSAYQTLVKQHLKPISHYAFRLLGNQKDTEDITQEVFLRLWTNAEKWKPEKSKLTTWLHRITHNLCIDYLRKHGRMQTQDSFDDETEDAPPLEDERSGEDAERLDLLREAMDSLPENQRSALSLCHYQGFSNKEAAAIMNISVKALESAIARAKRNLREILATN